MSLLDGRSGRACPDCGAYLQSIRVGGEDMLRCPWANNGSWRIFTHNVLRELHCDRPMISARVIGGIATVTPKTQL